MVLSALVVWHGQESGMLNSLLRDICWHTVKEGLNTSKELVLYILCLRIHRCLSTSLHFLILHLRVSDALALWKQPMWGNKPQDSYVVMCHEPLLHGNVKLFVYLASKLRLIIIIPSRISIYIAIQVHVLWLKFHHPHHWSQTTS